MRISDWSSDVCSSDLIEVAGTAGEVRIRDISATGAMIDGIEAGDDAIGVDLLIELDRKSVVEGKSVTVSVDLGGRRILKKKQRKSTRTGCQTEHRQK